MDAPDTSPQNWFNYTVSVLVGVISFMLNIYRKKVDDLEKRHGDFVTREELERHVDQIREDKQQMHTENLSRFDRIDNAVSRVHERIDQEWGR
jgi:dissimilatory sulfite reductase (desulfoviridin) alpha/beta subunit